MEVVAKIEEKRWWGSLNALPMNAVPRHTLASAVAMSMHVKSHTRTSAMSFVPQCRGVESQNRPKINE